MMGPAATSILPEIVAQMDIDDDGTLAQKMQMVSQMSLQGGGDPQAAQMMKQENDMLKQQVMQMQGALNDKAASMAQKEMDIKADILKQQMELQTRLEIEQMKLRGAQGIQVQKDDAAAQRQTQELQADLLTQVETERLKAEQEAQRTQQAALELAGEAQNFSWM